MKFTYRCGQQPLPGYTIKRGIGWGGFGEVYFAVSEGGKEVALKWVRNNLDVELRGIQQCLNLKHPHLVHLYDLRTDKDGNYWLVMEYVSGEPLSVILARHENGVAPELAVEWFQGLAGAIHYLHEAGIVHRDLKPGNIFLESGLIKVGDYGLCKQIGHSQHAGLTQNVGTVHYMAPEISTGNYNKQIDVYAAGVILYEMLTGRVPFDGESAGEILMKHLTSTPNVAKVPEKFRPIVERALAKNPANRFDNIAEMGKRVAAVGRAELLPLAKNANAEPEIPVVQLVQPSDSAPTPPSQPRFAELSAALLWSVAAAGLLSAAWFLFAPLLVAQPEGSAAAKIFFLTVAACWAVLIPTRLWSQYRRDDTWSRRLVLMGCGFLLGLFALWLEGYSLPLPGTNDAEALRPWTPPQGGPRRASFFTALYGENQTMPVLTGYLCYFGLMFLILRWWKPTEPTRRKPFSLKPLIAAGGMAFLLLFLLPSTPHRHAAFVSLILTAATLQIVSPWRPREASSPVKRRRYVKVERVQKVAV